MNNRNTLLDGLRGLLSLIVMLNHSFLVVAIPSYADVWGQNYFAYFDLSSKIQQIMMILGNGGAAVSMFFVLSGFVLNYSLGEISWNPKSYIYFLFKRLLRLYPAFFFTITLISIFRWLGFDYRQFPHASTWYHWWMNFKLDGLEYFLNTIFVHINLGGVTWTLRVIVIFSFLAPMFYWLSQKLPAIANLIFVAALIYLSFGVLNIPGFRDLRYMYMFYLGLIIPQLKTVFERIPKQIIYFTFPFLIYYLLTVRYQKNEYLGGVYESLICFVLLGLINYQPQIKLFNVLNNSFLQFLGKTSYSVYLIHFSVLYTLARILFQFFPYLNYRGNFLVTHIFLLITSALVTIPVSEFVYKYIEQPPLRLLKKDK